MTETEFRDLDRQEKRVLITSHFGYSGTRYLPDPLFVAGRMYAKGYGVTMQGPPPELRLWSVSFHQATGPKPDAGIDPEPAMAAVIGALRALGVIVGSA